MHISSNAIAKRAPPPHRSFVRVRLCSSILLPNNRATDLLVHLTTRDITDTHTLLAVTIRTMDECVPLRAAMHDAATLEAVHITDTIQRRAIHALLLSQQLRRSQAERIPHNAATTALQVRLRVNALVRLDLHCARRRALLAIVPPCSSSVRDDTALREPAVALALHARELSRGTLLVRGTAAARTEGRAVIRCGDEDVDGGFNASDAVPVVESGFDDSACAQVDWEGGDDNRVGRASQSWECSFMVRLEEALTTERANAA